MHWGDSADPGAWCVLQDVRGAEPAGRWRGGWLGGRAAQQWAEAVLARGLQAWDAGVAPVQPLFPPPACLAQNTEADLGWNWQKEQKEEADCAGKGWIQHSEGLQQNDKVLPRMEFLCESIQPMGARASHSSSMTRCSTWLKYLYSASTFWEDWKVLKANLREKKNNVKRRLLWKNQEF